MTPLRVLIVDDQALVRAGFRLILEANDGIQVVGEAADGEEGPAGFACQILDGGAVSGE